MELNEKLQNLYNALGLNEAVDAKMHGRKHGPGAKALRSKRQKAVEPVAGKAQSARHKAFYNTPGTADERRDAGDAAATAVRTAERKKRKALNAGTEFEMTGEILAEALYNSLSDMAIMISEVLSPEGREEQMRFKGKGKSASRIRGERKDRLRAANKARKDRGLPAIQTDDSRLTPAQQKEVEATRDSDAAKQASRGEEASRSDSYIPRGRREP